MCEPFKKILIKIHLEGSLRSLQTTTFFLLVQKKNNRSPQTSYFRRNYQRPMVNYSQPPRKKKLQVNNLSMSKHPRESKNNVPISGQSISKLYPKRPLPSSYVNKLGPSNIPSGRLRIPPKNKHLSHKQFIFFILFSVGKFTPIHSAFHSSSLVSLT